MAPPVSMLLGQLLLMLAVPIALGMWIRRRRPAVAERYRPLLQNLTFAGVGLVLALIILDNPGAFVGGLSATVPLAAVFVACSSAAGWLTAVPFTADRRDRFTFGAEFGTRNLGVAMAIAVTLLGRVEFARFAYTYFLIEMPLMLAAIALFRTTAARAASSGIPEHTRNI
jgi:BASS family bile acid:Na+ symporter